MASIFNSLQFSAVHKSRFPQLYKVPSITSTTLRPIRNGLFSSEAKHFEFSGKPLRFTGFGLKKKNCSFEFPIIKAAAAADADGQEIEISNGFSRATTTKSIAERFPALVTGFFFFF
ncbi:hypothetical protein M9H77_09799 [Catharanthus roseus]|uniref:Uncharacterized protein n=1 Tax=Catharanthus roseus TaxID=4058 RepID=A0ACC0C1U0_CATRO|nr:hypothetical protein M9H77_09799 [Catharanthus roseus]